MCNEREIQALRLISSCGRGKGLTELGNVLVSRQANALVAAGLIRQAPARWVAYELTTAGKVALSS